MSKISFVIFTYNEEKRIPYVIENFIKYGEVLIMDGGSLDKTKEISESLGAKFFLRPKNDKAYVETQDIFSFVKENISTDYIYWGFADNIAPKTLIEKFVQISTEGYFKIVYVSLYTYLWGNVENYALKSYTPFFFHKDFIDFSDNQIHSMGKFLGSKKESIRLPNSEEYSLRHFSSYNSNKFTQGHLRYAEEEALGMFVSGKKFGIFKMLKSMLKFLFIWGRQGIKGGALSLIIPLNYAFFRLMVYTKLFELENEITLNSIEVKYSEEKKKILKKNNNF